MNHPHEIEFHDHIIRCEEKQISAGYVMEMHWHEYIEIELILAGEAEHIHNSELTTVARGNAYIITSHDYHAFHALSDIKLLHICFESAILDEEILDTLTFIGNKNLCAVFSEHELAPLCQKLAMLSSEEKSDRPLRHVMAKAILHELIIDILRHGDGSPFQKPTLVQRLIAYISAEFRSELSLTEAANVFSLSPNYVGRKFREQTGMSFHDYLNGMRLQYACNMLKYSSLSIKEIAALSGYASVEYFFYIFKKHMGITPKEYRISK